MTKIIILAAGKGTRMGLNLPKALVQLNGRSLISYLAESVARANVDSSPIVIVSPDNKEIINEELSRYNWQYAVQTEQMGTGHAVACAKLLIPADCDKVVVLYCDHPFITAESIEKFAALDTKAVTIMPTKLEDYNDWRHNYYYLGRIIRNQEGRVEGITEFKDANEEELAITEINTGFMCFNNEWLWKNIEKLTNNNNNKEYYLTSLIEIAFAGGHEIGTIMIDAKEAMGINSQEELLIAENIDKT